MATTFTLELKKTPTSQGRFPIFIRITKDRKHKRIKTSVELNHMADWNKKGAKNQNWVRTSERNAAQWNKALADELEAARALYRENMQASIDSLQKRVKKLGCTTSFLTYAKNYTSNLGAVGKSAAKHYQTLCNKLEAYLAAEGRKDLAFSDLSPALVASFESFLQKGENSHLKNEERRLHPNYIRTLLVKFRALANKAISEGYLAKDSYPFRRHTGDVGFAMPKEVDASKEALEESEVAAIMALEYEEGSWLWHTKNAFLFSFYCAGIRAGDLLQLRWANITKKGSRLEYTMGKNRKPRNYPLMPQAQQILALYHTESSKASDYIFPLLDSSAPYAKNANIDTMTVEAKKALFSQIYSKNALLNRNLKKIAEDAGIDKTLSFHISRHTFASIAILKNAPSKIVQEAMGHSSLATTEKYLHSISHEEEGSALKIVFAPSPEAKQDSLLAALKGLDKKELADLLGKLNEE